MKRSWFREWGWIYYPISWQDAIAVLLTLAFSVHIFIAVDRTSHSVSDTFYGTFPFIAPSLLILSWIASRASE